MIASEVFNLAQNRILFPSPWRKWKTKKEMREWKPISSFQLLCYITKAFMRSPPLQGIIMVFVFIKINTLFKIINTTLWLPTSLSDRENLKLVFVADITQALIG